MNLPRQTTLLFGGLALALSACSRDNPNFDRDTSVADTEGTTDTTDTDTNTSSTTASTTTATTTATTTTAGDGDGDGDGEPGDGDGEPTTGMEAPDVFDIGSPECIIETHAAPSIRFAKPSQLEGGMCHAEIGTWVRKVGQLNGNLLVNPCPEYCAGTCNEAVQMEVGSTGVSLPMVLPMVNDPNNQWLNCHYVEAQGLILEEAGGCYYSSLSLHTDEGPQSPLLVNVNRDGWGLTPGAAAQFGDWHPQLVDQDVPTCECAELDIDCCMDQTVVVKKFQPDPQLMPNSFVYPGGQAQVNLFANNYMAPFTFVGLQAQSGTNCEIDPESSWALISLLIP